MRVKHLLLAALALGAFGIVTPTTVHAAGHYKILKTSYVNPQQYRVKGNILSEKFKGKVHSKYRKKTTWFGTQEKALVRTPAGKKAIYYAVGTYIPQLDGQNADIHSKALAGWTWHKNLYHKRSLAQPKADMDYLRQEINSIPKKSGAQALADLNKVKPGTAYQFFCWPSHWVKADSKNMKELMNQLNNEKTLANVVQDLDFTPNNYDDNLTTKGGTDADPMFRLKVMSDIYYHFRPRFKDELTASAFKRPDNYAKHIKEMSTWSQDRYNAYVDKHNDAYGAPYSPQGLGDDYMFQLITGLGRSNTSFKEDTVNNF